MKFDFWTFAFQIVNFAVLLFILRRLLFKPVREIMEKRRALAAKTMDEAEKARKEAEELRAAHQAQVEAFRQQHARRMEELEAEVAREREKRLGEALREIELVIAKERALFDADKKRCSAEIKALALESAEAFSANILRDVADESLHRALYRKLLGEADKIAAALQNAAPGNKPLKVEIVSARPFADDEISALRETLAKGTSRPLTLASNTDGELLAGVKIRAGDLLFDGSLRGQLTTLSERLRKTI